MTSSHFFLNLDTKRFKLPNILKKVKMLFLQYFQNPSRHDSLGRRQARDREGERCPEARPHQARHARLAVGMRRAVGARRREALPALQELASHPKTTRCSSSLAKPDLN